MKKVTGKKKDGGGRLPILSMRGEVKELPGSVGVEL
jgi:hypothetical protein